MKEPRPREATESAKTGASAGPAKTTETAAAASAAASVSVASAEGEDKDGVQATHSTVVDKAAHAAADSDASSRPRVAIVEIGAGGNVVTVRMRSEQFLQRWSVHADCKLIRINPDLPLADNINNNEKYVVEDTSVNADSRSSGNLVIT